MEVKHTPGPWYAERNNAVGTLTDEGPKTTVLGIFTFRAILSLADAKEPE